MLIVIEGPDGSGKTTIGRRAFDLLSEDGSTEIRHFGAPRKDPLIEYAEAFDGYTPGAGRHLIVDRLHWGELVYGPIFRGETKLGHAGLMAINDLIARLGGVIVNPYASVEVLQDRVCGRLGRQLSRYEDPASTQAVSDLFAVVAGQSRNESQVRILRVDTETNSPTSIAATAMRMARGLEKEVTK